MVSCLRIIAPPLTDLHVKKCNPESAFFPQVQCILEVVLSNLIPNLRRLAVRHALLLMRFAPIGAGMSHWVAFGAPLSLKNPPLYLSPSSPQLLSLLTTPRS